MGKFSDKVIQKQRKIEGKHVFFCFGGKMFRSCDYGNVNTHEIKTLLLLYLCTKLRPRKIEMKYIY